MSRHLVVFAALSLATLGVAQGLSARQTRLIDHVFQSWDEVDTPGVAVAVIREGKPVYRKAFGSADLERNVALTPEHVFFVASVSKQFTAMCVLLLEEEGKLSLDDDVRKHLPDFPDYGKTITIRHLVTHTSGIRDYYSLNSLRGEDIYEFYTDRDVYEMLKRQKALNAEPGEEYNYSNSGYFLLKEVIEKASGKPFHVYAKESIFDPLGMKDTSFQTSVSMLVPNRTLAYGGTFKGGYTNAHNSDAVVGGRGLLTTLDDMTKWLANFKDNQLGKKRQSLITKMTTRMKTNDGEEISYALGVTVGDYKGVKRIGHSGFFAGYRTRVYSYPDEDTEIIVFANSYGIDPNALANDVADIVLSDRFTAPKEGDKPRDPKPVLTDASSLISKVGLFRNKEGAILEVLLSDNGIVVASGANVTRKLIAEEDGGFYDPASGDVLTFEQTGAEGEALVVKPREGKEQRFVRAPRVKYDESSLKEFVGKFHSDELDVWHEVVLEDGKLKIKVGNDTIELSPNEVGEFACSLGTIQFRQDKGGYVVLGSRVKRIELARKG